MKKRVHSLLVLPLAFSIAFGGCGEDSAVDLGPVVACGTGGERVDGACICDAGYEASPEGNCIDIDECATNNGGCGDATYSACTNTPGGNTCADIDECASDNGGCGENALCANLDGEAQVCTCKPGFLYSPDGICVPTPACQFVDCEGNSHCEAGNCVCDAGYEADTDGSCIDIDECEEGTATCTENSNCTNTPGNYACPCDAGYEEHSENEACEDVNECEEGAATCTENSTCSNTAGGYECPCDLGYLANTAAGTCDDVNECEEGTATCTENSSCVNTVGGYECPCHMGYLANTATGTCDDVNECEEGTATCTENSTCSNTVGGYECPCNLGYLANTATGTCGDVNECEEGTATCTENSSCVNTAGGYECPCDMGYLANTAAGTCDDVNECEEGTFECEEDFGCVNNIGGYDCACAPVGTPPIIALSSPSRGEAIQGGPGPASVPLSAIVSDSGVGLASLSLNGVSLEIVEGMSEIALDQQLDTTWGLNTVWVTAEDLCGNTSVFVSSFLHSEDYFPALASPDVTASHDAMKVTLGQVLFDDGDRSDLDDLASLVHAAFQNLDLNAAFPGILAVTPDENGDGNIDSATYTCGFPPVEWTETNQKTGYRVTKKGAVTYGSPVVDYLKVVDGGVTMKLSISNFNMPIQVHGHVDSGCLGETGLNVIGDVRANKIALTGHFGVVLDDDGVALIWEATSVALNVTELYIDIDWGLLDLISGLLTDLANQTLDHTVSTVENALVSGLESYLKPTAEPFFQNVRFGPLESTCLGACQVDLAVTLNALSCTGPENEGEVFFGFSSQAYPPGLAEWFSAENQPGSIRHASTELSPQVGASAFGSTLEDNLFNQIFWSIWAQGALDFNEDMTVSWAPDDGDNYALTLSHRVPPVFMPTQSETGLQIGFGDIHLQGTKEGSDGADPKQIDLFVTVLAPASVDVFGGTSLLCALGEQGEWNVSWAIAGDHDLDLAQTGALVETALGAALPNTLSTLCAPVPLPVIDVGGLAGLPNSAMLTTGNLAITRYEQVFELNGSFEFSP